MVRLSFFVSLALAAQGLHAAPSVSRDQDISASKQMTDILARRVRNGGGDLGCPTERPGGRTAAEGEAERIAKGGDYGGFPSPEKEERTQLTNAQKNGFRGDTKFKDTPGGKAAAEYAKNAGRTRQ